MCTHVLREMSSLVALAALNTLSRAGLRTLLGAVPLQLAVTAGVRILALLGAITSTMTILLAVDTLDDGLVRFVLRSFLLAVLHELLVIIRDALHELRTLRM